MVVDRDYKIFEIKIHLLLGRRESFRKFWIAQSGELKLLSLEIRTFQQENLQINIYIYIYSALKS